MTIYEQYSIVDVPFPFIDVSGKKRRPALVLSKPPFQPANGAVILAMITSADRNSWKFDLELADWSAAGLRKKCLVRWKVFTLDAALVAGLRGALSDRDKSAVNECLSAMFF